MKVTGSATLLQICSGTIGTRTISNAILVFTRFSVKVTVFGSVASTEEIRSQMFWVSSSRRLRSISKVKTTSRALNGWPSDHSTPSRRWKDSFSRLPE